MLPARISASRRLDRGGILQRGDLDQRPVGISLDQRGMDIARASACPAAPRAAAALPPACRDRNARRWAGTSGGWDRPGMLLHLRQMLVAEVQAIDARHRLGVVGGVSVLEFRDHGLAAAGIAGDAADAERENRPARYRPAPAAARWPESRWPSSPDCSPVWRRRSWRSHPARVRRSHRPSLRATRWALEASITRVAGLSIRVTASRAASSGRHRITISAAFSARLAGGRILALGIRQRDQRQLGAAGQALADFEPGGAGGAVDEDFGLFAHGSGAN